MFLHAHRIVAAAVERLGVDTPEVANARQRHGDQAIDEFVHHVAAQGDLGADRETFADLELRDGLLGTGLDCLLAGDRGQVVHGLYDFLAVGSCLARADVQHDLVQLRNLKRVLVTELLHQLRLDGFGIALLEARHITGFARMLADLHLGAGVHFAALVRLVRLRLGLGGFLRILAACIRHR